MSKDFGRIDVTQAFRDHEVLITGINGFLGKVLLGLILEGLPEFKHLHILLRSSANLSAQDRFYTHTLRSPAVDAFANKSTEIRGAGFLAENITVWEGDISRTDCGLEPAALERLTGRLGAIINCAGLVEFFPPVDDAFASNVDGVEHVVALARQIGAKLVHVSTCYVCGEADGLIEETEAILGYYPHRRGPQDSSFNHHEEISHCRQRIREIYDSERSHGSELPPGVVQSPRRPEADSGARYRPSKQSVQRLIALGKQRAEHWGWVNTYTYSKSLGEQIIAGETTLDSAIVRPAIVESALRFPFAGWIEGGRTAAPLVLMALSGLKHWPLRRDIPLEVVPVDLVASAILIITALLLEGRHEPVYQLASADVNPIDLESVVRLLHDEFRRRGDNGAQRNGRQGVATSILERLVGAKSAGSRGRLRFLSAEQARAQRVRLQERVGKAQDLIVRTGKILENFKMPGKRRLSAWNAALRALGLQAGFREQTLDQYLPFVLYNRYIFESQNIRDAYSRLSERDRQLLRWDPERIDWNDYWINCQIRGIEQWVQPEAVKEWNFKI